MYGHYSSKVKAFPDATPTSVLDHDNISNSDPSRHAAITISWHKRWRNRVYAAVRYLGSGYPNIDEDGWSSSMDGGTEAGPSTVQVLVGPPSRSICTINFSGA